MSKKGVGVGFGVMMIRDGSILLGKRHNDPLKADSELRGEGTWTMPGGKLETGESFEEGAQREVLEETGIVLKSAEVICVNNDMNQYAHFVTIGLHSEDFEGEAQVMEPDEITEWRWFDLNDLPKNMFTPSVHVLENYRQRKFYITRTV